MTVSRMLVGTRFVGRTGVRQAALVAAAVFGAACGTKDAADPLQPTGPTGRIRFVNLITDPARNPVNAILEGVPFGVNLGYTQSTPSTLPAPSTANSSAILAGDRSLVLKRTADTTVTVATLPISIGASNDYTLFATGGAGGSAVTGFTTADATTAVPTGQIRIRVVNMSPAAGAVDVFITAPNADLATATPAATALANRTIFAGALLAPGNYQIRTVPAGTAPAARTAAVSSSVTTPAAVAAGGQRTVIIADAATGGTPLRSFLLTDQ
jgi:hypothetical protein